MFFLETNFFLNSNYCQNKNSVPVDLEMGLEARKHYFLAYKQ